MSDAAIDTAPAPAPPEAPPDPGPTLPCHGCGKGVLAGLTRCPDCGGGTRPLAAVLLAAVAGLAGLAAAALYAREMAASTGAVVRPVYHFFLALAMLPAAASVFRGRRAGWAGLHAVWVLHLFGPLLVALLLRREVVSALIDLRTPKGLAHVAAVIAPAAVGLGLAWLPSVRAWCSAPSSLMTMTRREIAALLYIPQAYVVGILTPFLFFMGLFFYGFLVNAATFQVDAGIERIAGNLSTFLIFCAPFLTMGTFAEERRTGTLEMLVTAPVTDLDIVLAKFLGTLFFFLVALLVPAAVYVGFLAWVSNSPPDYGSITAGFLGVFLMATVYFAIGVFISSLTRNQIVAGIWTFNIFVAVWVTGHFAQQARNETIRTVLEHVNFVRYYEAFGRGVVDSRAVIYFASLTVLFLGLTVLSLVRRRWA